MRPHLSRCHPFQELIESRDGHAELRVLLSFCVRILFDVRRRKACAEDWKSSAHGLCLLFFGDFRQVVAFAVQANSVEAGPGCDVEQVAIFATTEADVGWNFGLDIVQLLTLR
jgi:hypothetical protein